jgi:hypothetical protein
MATKKNTSKKPQDRPGEERFVASGKGVILLKPGKGASAGGKRSGK